MEFGKLGVDPTLVEVCNSNNIVNPTEVQEKTIPIVLKGKDVVVVSQTGSGKTLAFVLPIITRILSKTRVFYAIIVSPTRELALQIVSCLEMFKSTGLRTCALIGGENFNAQAKKLSQQPHIVVGTPGRIVDHILKTKSFKARRVRKLVLDEADRFFEQDFTSELETIRASIREKRQTLLFTATLDKKIMDLVKGFSRNPYKINVSDKYESVDTLLDYYVLIPMKYKMSFIYSLLKERSGQSTMVFVKLCNTTKVLSALLQQLQINAEPLYGDLDQKKREKTIEKFRNKEFNILVCTDVGSRGLDIPHVECVINYDVPQRTKDYVHRVGRTARAGRDGEAITIVTQYDVEEFQKIEHKLGRKLIAYENNIEFKSYYKKVEECLEKVTTNFRDLGKRTK